MMFREVRTIAVTRSPVGCQAHKRETVICLSSALREVTDGK